MPLHDSCHHHPCCASKLFLIFFPWFRSWIRSQVLILVQSSGLGRRSTMGVDFWIIIFSKEYYFWSQEKKLFSENYFSFTNQTLKNGFYSPNKDVKISEKWTCFPRNHFPWKTFSFLPNTPKKFLYPLKQVCLHTTTAIYCKCCILLLVMTLFAIMGELTVKEFG